MSVDIANYSFFGPYTSGTEIKDVSGVFVILCKGESETKVIDCGHSNGLKSTLDGHASTQDWVKQCSGELLVAVMYTTPGTCAGIASDICAKYNIGDQADGG